MDEITAEVTAMAMGWQPMELEDGTKIWVRSKDIGVDEAPYCAKRCQVVWQLTVGILSVRLKQSHWESTLWRMGPFSADSDPVSRLSG